MGLSSFADNEDRARRCGVGQPRTLRRLAVTGDAEAAVKENLARRREEYDFRRLFFCIFISEYCMSN